MEFSGSRFSAALEFMFYLVALLSVSIPVAAIDGVNVKNQVVEVTPTRLIESTTSKDLLLCGRVRVSGISRLKLGSYSSAHRITLVPSVVIPERLHKKIQICFHRNSSFGLCQCDKDSWKSLQNGMWSTVMSPYEDGYIDVKFLGDFSGSVTVALEVELQRWRLICLSFGLLLLLLAPIVSSWVPFYYSSSMAIGVCLVIIILLFQGMKLLPTGRKNFFYLTIYGSVLGAGSFLMHHFSMFVNSILVNFGLSEEMHNPVAVFVLVGIILAGAAFGHWLVRKFVVSEDGNVDVGVAQFVKWAMRMIAVTSIFQSTLDTPLAMALLSSTVGIYFSLTSMKWHVLSDIAYSVNGGPWLRKTEILDKKYKRAEFLSKLGTKNSRRTSWNSPSGASAWTNSPVKGTNWYSKSGTKNSRGTAWSSPSPSAWSDSPVKGIVSPPNLRGTRNQRDYYSTYHKTKDRKKFSEEEWEELTEESTRQAMAELASSPEFCDWIVDNAKRIQLRPDDSSDESIGSGSDSTDEHAAESTSGFRLFKWRRD